MYYILNYQNIATLTQACLMQCKLHQDHNGNKQDLSAFCAILGYPYICNNVQHRIIVLYIAE